MRITERQLLLIRQAIIASIEHYGGLADAWTPAAWANSDAWMEKHRNAALKERKKMRKLLGELESLSKP